MSLLHRSIFGLSLSGVLHIGLAALYIQTDNQSTKVILGEQTTPAPFDLALFEPVAKTVAIAQAKSVVKKPEPSSNTSLKPSHEEVAIEPTQAEPAQVEVFEQEAIAASQMSDPVLNTQPIYYSQKAPRYPRKALSKGQQGTVLLMLVVNEQGHVIDVDVMQSSGVTSLDKAAAKAVKKWRLQPVKSHGVAVVSRVKVPVRFNLQAS